MKKQNKQNKTQTEQVNKTQTILRALLVTFLIIACVGVGVLGWLSEGFRNWNTNDWKQTVSTPTTVIQDGNGNDMSDTSIVYDMPKKMVFATTAADTSVTLNATVLPEDATNKKVTWAVCWVNASAEWATGKNIATFFTVTPSSDGATTATVNCAQAFGEQIKITVTSQSNPAAKAECVVDYVKRLESVDVKFGSEDNLSKTAINTLSFDLQSTNEAPIVPHLSYNLGVGTVEETLTTNITLAKQPYMYFQKYLTSHTDYPYFGLTLGEDKDITSGVSLNKTTFSYLFGSNIFQESRAWNFVLAAANLSFVQMQKCWTDYHKDVYSDNYCKDYIDNSLNNIVRCGILQLRIKVEGAYTKNFFQGYDLTINTNSLSIQATSISLSNSTLTF